MIKNKQDYKKYIEADRLVAYVKNKRPRPFMDHIQRYLITMRKIEYIANCKNGLFYKILYKFYKFKLYRLSIKTHFSIPENVAGEGLCLFHHGTIIINGTSRLGKYCQIQCGVNIADKVEIGNYVTINPGVKILKGVKIADGVRIGANSVVSRSILEPNITVAGVPAKKISNIGSDRKNVYIKDGEYKLEIIKYNNEIEYENDKKI